MSTRQRLRNLQINGKKYHFTKETVFCIEDLRRINNIYLEVFSTNYQQHQNQSKSKKKIIKF